MNSQDPVRLAIDVMGGDIGPDATIPGVERALGQYSNLHCLLVGNETAIRSRIARGLIDTRVSVVSSTEVVEMDESPAAALRFKKNSSMRVAINLLASGEADACVSSGNTGALMATGRFVLKMLPGIDRPAIIAPLPRANGHVHVLDLGANVGSSPATLAQFALMGESMLRSLEALASPSVGLLNIGSEENKGNDTVKAAAELIKDSGINYVGYVEGDDIFNGSVDLIVCDGFEGNIALKTSEGLAQMLSKIIKEEFFRNPFRKIAGLIASPVLKSVRARMDHRQYNGAMLLGLNGALVKSHGGADALAFANAIGVARLAASKNVVNQIKRALSDHPGLLKDAS
ncbi:MAG: phosphate acyltransferase PlsX [Arenicellales bacterium]